MAQILTESFGIADALSQLLQGLPSLPLHDTYALGCCKSCKMSLATLPLLVFPFWEPEIQLQICCVSLIT